MIKKIPLGVGIILSIVLLFLAKSPDTKVKSYQPVSFGNGNCLYVDGSIRTCPASYFTNIPKEPIRTVEYEEDMITKSADHQPKREEPKPATAPLDAKPLDTPAPAFDAVKAAPDNPEIVPQSGPIKIVVSN